MSRLSMSDGRGAGKLRMHALAFVAALGCGAGACSRTSLLAGDEDPASPGALQCPLDHTDCDGACAILAVDRLHCGACGQMCDVAQICENSQCIVSCPSGQRACGDVCVDSAWGCEGMLPSGCPVGHTRCEEECVDLAHDDEHCGACDSPCGLGQSCDGGACHDVQWAEMEVLTPSFQDAGVAGLTITDEHVFMAVPISWSSFTDVYYDFRVLTHSFETAEWSLSESWGDDWFQQSDAAIAPDGTQAVAYGDEDTYWTTDFPAGEGDLRVRLKSPGQTWRPFARLESSLDTTTSVALVARPASGFAVAAIVEQEGQTSLRFYENLGGQPFSAGTTIVEDNPLLVRVMTIAIWNTDANTEAVDVYYIAETEDPDFSDTAYRRRLMRASRRSGTWAEPAPVGEHLYNVELLASAMVRNAAGKLEGPRRVITFSDHTSAAWDLFIEPGREPSPLTPREGNSYLFDGKARLYSRHTAEGATFVTGPLGALGENEETFELPEDALGGNIVALGDGRFLQSSTRPAVLQLWEGRTGALSAPLQIGLDSGFNRGWALPDGRALVLTRQALGLSLGINGRRLRATFVEFE